MSMAMKSSKPASFDTAHAPITPPVGPEPSAAELASLNIEERVLSNRVMELALGYGEESGLLTVVQQDAARYSTPPRDELEASAELMDSSVSLVCSSALRLVNSTPSTDTT